MTKPIAFIDVDGVLNRLIWPLEAVKRGLIETVGYPSGKNGEVFDLALDPADSDRLLSLTPEFELAWGTTWEDAANVEIGPKIGLPQLDLVAKAAYTDRSKWPGIVKAAVGRPFVWFEDDKYYLDRWNEYIVPSQPFLVINVDPQEGLTDRHIELAKEFYVNLA